MSFIPFLFPPQENLVSRQVLLDDSCLVDWASKVILQVGLKVSSSICRREIQLGAVLNSHWSSLFYLWNQAL